MNSKGCGLREQKLQGYIIKKFIVGWVLYDGPSYHNITTHKNIFFWQNGIYMIVTEREFELFEGIVAFYCMANIVVSHVVLTD